MGQADDIRDFVYHQYILPARRRGESYTSVRSGDVHMEMRLSNAMPNICSALEAAKFSEMADVQLLGRKGPYRGANVLFEFGLTGSTRSVASSPVSSGSVGERPSRTTSSNQRSLEEVDFRNALVLVSCVKSKMSHAAPARSLYTSAWFSMVRDIVERSGARWLVLSALYGLVGPHEEIPPYDYTLNRVGVGIRQQWAAKVLASLRNQSFPERRVIMFAGQRYREFLIGPLKRMGCTIEVPMIGLRWGEQLAWLRRNI